MKLSIITVVVLGLFHSFINAFEPNDPYFEYNFKYPEFRLTDEGRAAFIVTNNALLGGELQIVTKDKTQKLKIGEISYYCYR